MLQKLQYISLMNQTRKGQDQNKAEHQKSKVSTSIQSAQSGQIFHKQMTNSQANYINKLLPKFYMLFIHRPKPNTRINLSKSAQKIENTNEMKELRNQSSSRKKIEQILVKQPIFQQRKQIITPFESQTVKKCRKYLTLLKKNKYSWPFRQPVDPIAMKIPNYAEIVKNPMDLKTVQENLNSNKYATVNQFYADIELIIRNSKSFNEFNEQFMAVTLQFQNYFQKFKNQQFGIRGRAIQKDKAKTDSKTSIKVSQTQKAKRNPSKPIIYDANMKKQIVAKLRLLQRSQLLDLLKRLNSPDSMEINLETMECQKIKRIQQYLQERQKLKIKVKQGAVSITKKQNKENNQKQSSFQSESDS